MNGAGYILAAWLIVAAVVLVYAARLVQRERSLSRQVPPERARWLGGGDR